MGLYVKQSEPRTQLSSRVSAQLSERLSKRGAAATNDDSEQAILLKNQRKTTSGGLFWTIFVAIVALVLLGYVMFIL